MKKLVFNESEIVGEADICGKAIDLINRESSDCESMSIATILINPGDSSQRHFHKVMEEIYYFVEGEGLVELGGEICHVGPGIAVFIPRNLLHHIENTGSTTLKLISVDSPPFDTQDIYLEGQ